MGADRRVDVSVQQLADLFPKQRPNTPPISPDELRSGHLTSAKRRRSDHDSATDENSRDPYPPHKRRIQEWTSPRGEAAHHSDRSGREAESPNSSRQSARSPLSRPHEFSQQKSPVAYYSQGHAEQNQPAVSPRSNPQQSITTKASDSFTRPQPYPSQGASKPTSSESLATVGSQYMSHSRVLPPLFTPQSPRNHLDRKLEGSKGPLSAVEPAHYSQTAAPKYGYTPYNLPPPTSNPPTRHASATEITHAQPDVKQYRTPSHPQPLHPAFSPKAERAPAYDPIRPQLTNPWRPADGAHSNRALPPMPGLTDPIPPPLRAPAQELAGPDGHPRTASHSLDRYRFDAPPAAEHPARRRRGNLPKEATARLNEWFAQHASYPYPKEEEKQALQEQTGLTMSQVSLRSPIPLPLHRLA